MQADEVGLVTSVPTAIEVGQGTPALEAVKPLKLSDKADLVTFEP